MDKLARVKLRTGEDNDNLLLDILETAKYAILNRLYPFGNYTEDENGEPVIPARYDDLQVRMAIDLYNRIGAEGQLSHSENGISRSYDGSWISEALLAEIVPVCKAVN